jgi:uncharacterized membrane protein required for colicin V production
MGLDVTLGVIILVAAFRGYFQGFITQAVRIAGLVACVYLAEPVRDYSKPRVLPYLPTIDPALIDRLLWWVSAAVTYIVLVGLATLVIKMTRRPEIPGIAQSGRNDQFAGFMLGASKGILVAAVSTAAVQKYALEPIKTVPWAEAQVKTSWAGKWNEQYQPVPKIWSSPPVRQFVTYVERMGMRTPGESSDAAEGDDDDRESPAVRTASRPAAPNIATDGRHAAGDEPVSEKAPGSPSMSPPNPPDAGDQAIADLKAELKKEPKGSD